MHPHLVHLAENVFHTSTGLGDATSTRWPHYRLLLSDMQALHEQYQHKRVLSLERSIKETCGDADGTSRWLPLFKDITVVNHGLYDARKRYIPHKGSIPRRREPIISPLGALESQEKGWDLVIVPNLLHHVRDGHGFFRALRKIVGEGDLYIFDTPFREVHDAPGHYCMYTPYGIQAMLEDIGFKDIELSELCSFWEALLYCLDFAECQVQGSIIPEYQRALLLANALKDEPTTSTGLGDAPKDGRRMCMAWSVRARVAAAVSTPAIVDATSTGLDAHLSPYLPASLDDDEGDQLGRAANSK